jgi:hypothetical protein
MTRTASGRILGLQPAEKARKTFCTTRKTFAFNANDLHQMQNKNHPFV